MKSACRLLGHSVAPKIVENRGFQFSRCRRCRCDMIRSTARSSSKWVSVPSDLRVTWNDVNREELLAPAWFVVAARRISAVFSNIRDAFLMAPMLLYLNTVDGFRKIRKRISTMKFRHSLVILATSPINIKQWRLTGGLGGTQKMLRFECIFERRTESVASY